MVHFQSFSLDDGDEWADYEKGWSAGAIMRKNLNDAFEEASMKPSKLSADSTTRKQIEVHKRLCSLMDEYIFRLP